MREYGRTEVIREKCHWCGCKNKLVTYLKDDCGEEVGMIIRCCACGKILTHVDPAIYSTVNDLISGKMRFSRDKCVQESFCPHTQCPHYGQRQRHNPGDKKPDTKSNATDKIIDRSVIEGVPRGQNLKFVPIHISLPLDKNLRIEEN